MPGEPIEAQNFEVEVEVNTLENNPSPQSSASTTASITTVPIKAVPVARIKPQSAVALKARLITRVPNSEAETLKISEISAPEISAPGVHQPELVELAEGPRPGLIRRLYRWFKTQVERIFGVLVLMLGLAVLAVIPIAQFLSLGYLLEASGRIGRSGRLRDGFIGLPKAARAGGLVLGIWLMMVPLRLLSSYYVESRLIDPASPATNGLAIALAILTPLMMIHIAIACACGGRLRHFLFPFMNPIHLYRNCRQGNIYTRSRDAVWDFSASLRLHHYFWLGLRGFVGSLLWLLIPITLLALGLKVPILGLLGGFLVAIVVLYLPFLQVHFAAENRFRALFELGEVRRRFCRAPIAFWFGLLAALLFPLPLYLLKIEVIPQEAGWIPSLVFIGFMFPAHLLTGWAYGRAQRREGNRHWISRWSARLTTLPIGIFYAFMVFATQYISWEGIGSLYGQHAFLLPVPFFNFPT